MQSVTPTSGTPSRGHVCGCATWGAARYARGMPNPRLLIRSFLDEPVSAFHHPRFASQVGRGDPTSEGPEVSTRQGVVVELETGALKVIWGGK